MAPALPPVIINGRKMHVHLDHDEVRVRWGEHWTMPQLADHFGVSLAFMNKFCVAIGLRRGVGWKPPGFSAWGKRYRTPDNPVPPPALPPLPVVADERAAIAQYIRERGVTKLPPAYAAPTQGCKA